MPSKLVITLFIFAIITMPSLALSTEKHGTDCTSCHSLSDKDATQLLGKVGGSVKSVKQAPVKGFYELLMEKDGKQGIIYLDFARKNLIQGMVLNIETLQPVSAHDLPKPKQVTSVDPKTIPLDKAVVIGNPKGTKKLFVFTDPDCPFCRNLHVELKKLEKTSPDLAIYVMLFPLPMHPAAFDKSRTAFEKKTHEVIDMIFEGKEVPKPASDSSKKAIEEIIKFGSANGISGTPTMVFPDGKLVVGGRDAEGLKQMLDGK